ncbi:nucleotide exchange factor GrpE [Noviherbaspirillum sp. Root189]|uniref:nucleotide exchange factor GrpE n=1 Tax=Noviherbaspirillum sp. Root189 TaxID=1736487 RepID=UPI00138F44FD|nr:nucleotide exchange factor GrpE [Noviherbaspirillum sp. Root189]
MRDTNNHCNNDDKYQQSESSAMKPDNAAKDQDRESKAAHQIRIAKRLQAVDEHIATLQNSVRAAIADVEYARRRAEADLAHAHRFAIEEFARSLLPFKDSLEAALMINTTDVQALRSGLALTLKLFQAALEKQGLVELQANPGDTLYPNRHRLLSRSSDIGSTPVVASVEQKGYAINGRLIRPVAVTVAPSN